MPNPFLAVDIGNNRLKLGRFQPPFSDCPRAEAVLSLTADNLDGLEGWLPDASTPLHWRVGSVNRPTTGLLVDWLHANRPDDEFVLLASGDLPLEVGLPRPDMVGIDRLLDAVAANRLRRPEKAAVVVDIGSAITVDVVSSEGRFLGGAILPGLEMSARALHEFTDLLPRVAVDDLSEVPASIGNGTIPAIRSGLFWGAVGAIDRLVRQAEDTLAVEAEVFLTGGGGEAVAERLDAGARWVPTLTLTGIALTERG